MPQGYKDKNSKFFINKWLQKSPKVKSVMALHQKLFVTRSTVCVESLILVSQMAQNDLLCRSSTD